jgi:DNA-binding CsgD family transcriptional regulator
MEPCAKGPTENVGQREVAARESRVRHNWPKGFFGWLAYLHDHGLCGYQRPINWSDLWAFEESSTAVYLFANGGAMVLDGVEIDVLRLLGRGVDDASIATALDISLSTIAKLRAEIGASLGIVTAADLTHLATTHGIR